MHNILNESVTSVQLAWLIYCQIKYNPYKESCRGKYLHHA